MTGEFKKILLPVDFSEYAEIAARKGVSLAKIYGATIYYLHGGDEARRSARKLSAFVKKIDADQQLSVKKLVAQGTPEKTILSVVRKIVPMPLSWEREEILDSNIWCTGV